MSRYDISSIWCECSSLSRRNAGRPVRRPDCTLATVDHNVPYVLSSSHRTNNNDIILRTSTRKNFTNVASFIDEPDSRAQCVALEENVKEFGLTYFGMTDKRQGVFGFRPFLLRPLMKVVRQELYMSLVPNRVLR